MENKTIFYLVLFIIVIYFLCVRQENYSDLRSNIKNNNDRLYSKNNFVLRDNLFLPKGIISEGEKIPPRDYASTWYYGFPLPSDTKTSDTNNFREPLSGFVKIDIPPNTSGNLCSVASFKNDPNTGTRNFCFEAEDDKIFGFEHTYLVGKPSGIFQEKSFKYGKTK